MLENIKHAEDKQNLLQQAFAECPFNLDIYEKLLQFGYFDFDTFIDAKKIFRKSEMDNLFIFLNKKDKDTVLDNYKLLSKDSLSSEDYKTYKESYPALKDEELYLLNTKDYIFLSLH